MGGKSLWELINLDLSIWENETTNQLFFKVFNYMYIDILNDYGKCLKQRWYLLFVFLIKNMYINFHKIQILLWYISYYQKKVFLTFISKILENLGKSFIEQYLNYILNYKNVVQYFDI